MSALHAERLRNLAARPDARVAAENMRRASCPTCFDTGRYTVAVYDRERRYTGCRLVDCSCSSSPDRARAARGQ